MVDAFEYLEILEALEPDIDLPLLEVEFPELLSWQFLAVATSYLKTVTWLH